MDVNIKRKAQVLKVNIPETLPKVFVDKDKIEQVFQNVLSNAYKYTPEGKYICIIPMC